MSKDIFPSIFSFGFDELMKSFDKQFQNLAFPPFNIRKENDNLYIIEMAVAGFSKNELNVEIDKGILKVSGNYNNSPLHENFVYKGISEKNFERQFVISDSIEVKNAELINGILRICLENMVNFSNSKKIPIKTQADILGSK